MKQNELTQRFCRNCATILTDTDICCPQCGFAVGTGMRFCPYCGDPAAVGATTCTTCCQPLMQTDSTSARNTAAPTMADANVAYAPPPVQQQPVYPQAAPPPVQRQTVHPQAAPPPVQYVPNNQQGGYAYRNGAMPQNTVSYNTYTAGAQKSKITGGILGIFLGMFGVHNFYLGYTGKAVAQLLLTLLSCFMLSPITEIWGLIEGIMILAGSISTDGKGVPLKD